MGVPAAAGVWSAPWFNASVGWEVPAAGLTCIEPTVRLKIIGNDIIKNVGKYQSCMVSKLPIIWKQTV